MSWINEYSRIHSVQQLMNREPIDDIVIQTIYMNHTLEIKKINKESEQETLNVNKNHDNYKAKQKKQGQSLY